MTKAYLMLADGTVFEGFAIGAVKENAGELIYKTDVVGYQELLTDPDHKGKILLQTFPQIGNYGVIPEDLKGICTVSGYVVREFCEQPSNFRSAGNLNDFLKKNGVPGIAGVDTRALTRILREKGSLQAKIVYEGENHAAE